MNLFDNFNENRSNTSSPWNIIGTLDRKKTVITRYAYSVLVLFAVASVVASWSKGADLGQLVVIAFLVFGLAIAVWSFQKMARANNKTWKAIGLISAVVVLLAMLSFFTSIVIFIISGHPQNLDRFFGNTQPLQSIYGEKIVFKSEDTVRITWQPYKPEETLIIVSYKTASDKTEFKEYVKLKPGAISTTITGLKPQTQYIISLVAEFRGRRSYPTKLVTTTNASSHFVGTISGYNLFYTGSMTDDGKATSKSGTIVFRIGLSSPDWIYKGEVKNGKPFGHGRMTSLNDSCGLTPSNCEIDIKKADQLNGTCTLYLNKLWLNNHFKLFKCLKYVGAVSSATNNTDNKSSYSLGPYLINLKGKGEITNLAPNDDININGSLLDGLLDGYVSLKYLGFFSFGHYEKGLLTKGVFINRDHPLGYIADITDTDAGPTIQMKMSEEGIDYGVFKGASIPEEGYSFRYAPRRNNFTAKKYNAQGDDVNLFLNSEVIFTRCTFNMNKNGWQLSCGTNGDYTSADCDLVNNISGIRVSASKERQEKPKITITTSGTGADPNNCMAISLDGLLFESNLPLYVIEDSAPAALIKMANSKYIKNVNNGITVPLDSVDNLISNLFGCLYYCTRGSQ